VRDPLAEIGGLDDEEAPRLLVRRAPGDPSRVEDAAGDVLGDLLVSVFALVPLARDGEKRVHPCWTL
jgi:hypothetical protein